MPGRTVVVIPCFDEADRLDPDRVTMISRSGVDVLLVDDGSSDGTVTLLRSLARPDPERSTDEPTGRATGVGTIEVLELGEHVGKAEAVRSGLVHATADPSVSIVGYCDADFATPPDEVLRLAAALARRPELFAAIGSRVDLLGHAVERPWARTVGNRVYSGVASRLLGARIRDTQCGAKFFRTGDALTTAISEPFADRWGFDVELLGRLLVGRGTVAPVDPDRIAEVPLERWTHVPGSKLGGGAAVTATLDLVHLRRRLRRWRRDGRSRQ